MVSCGPKIIYKEYKEINNNTWSKGNPIVFNLDIQDTSKKYDIILTVKSLDAYRFANVYVQVKTTFPDNKKVEDVVSLELTKSNGEANGTCSGEECSTPILFQENINFAQLGKYKIAIDQYSREQTINGIESLELKVMESKPKQ